ncbi:bifunctional UDP-N-acetylglucosamine diphosphorylase/glucosamine-1-phosphate N-acetyltransferase GlmU [Geobacter pickeringii]|uniref:Bifunctional protein GlmU n=1 Tax=Geobacter pickeringii TaxID=345632 RepID=A0A0B5BDK6_9BACT|nr:bifunctional UDP-N-acetylglucosamine diphosphorylase/glucosamine-1-phosphate N-acetyltransferase GlmU [Geobacter pickeringii]AJE04557.1 bifunctional N-acetylglucosamine-1-phosphate uridyltransferase/glucosamine-1-phosphate acetyltransferase [Geobacter pickeringii]
MADLAAIILAAGKGTRMKSDLVKVMHPLAGAPMVAWPVATARQAGAARIVTVIGHQAESIRGHFAGESDIVFALQEEQLGTGHAVACAAELLAGFTGAVLILCGDVPLIRPETLRAMTETHAATNAALTVLTTHLENPFGYGRIIRGFDGRVSRIVEEKDATAEERSHTEVNAGIYCAEASFLFDAVSRLGNDNAQGEYYLTDIVIRAAEHGLRCSAHAVADPAEVMGVNDRIQLAEAGRHIRRRIAEALMLDGVTIVDPSATYIDRGIVAGRDTTVHPGVHLAGETRLGTGCTIETGAVIKGSTLGDGCVVEPGAVIRNCRIGNDVVIKAGTVMEDAVIHEHAAIGPMAHLRPGTELGPQVKIGNFVETKKITMGEGSKASHLTYLGDAAIGKNVNVGCGTITCNYDGVRKHRTVIGDDVFVGSDVQFVAPVTIGRNSLIAAGTTVTQDVPPDSLAIARAPQVNKEGWKLKKREG